MDDMTNTDTQLGDLFVRIDMMLSDFEKILSASDGVNFANWAACGFGLQITEPIAKVCFPIVKFESLDARGRYTAQERPAYRRKSSFLRRRESKTAGWGRARQDTLADVNANDAVARFWRTYFRNPQYVRYQKFIWNSFRHKIVHLYSPAKVVDVPGFTEFKASFLSGGAIDGPDHLKFAMAYDRPFFRFNAQEYYKDIKEAVAMIKRDAVTNRAHYDRLVTGWELYCREYRIPFSEVGNRPEIISDLTQLSRDSGLLPS